MAITIRSRGIATRSPGYWMAVLVGVFQLVNAVRAAIDPVGFAAYMGLPVSADAATGFVLVYALRTAFIGAVVLLFCHQHRMIALKWMALIAVVLPIGDALLAAQAGAPMATIARHIAIGIFLLATFAFLRRVESGTSGTPS